MAPHHEQAARRAEIRPVKESVEDSLIAQPGVVAVDIADKHVDGQNTGELSIVVFVEKKLPPGKIPKGGAIPKEIDGVKTDVQELQVELQPAMTKLEGDVAFVDPAAYPTLAGGIGFGPRRSVYLTPPDVASPGNYVFVGTLGALVRDRATGATMALSNFHVACINNTWSVGDRQVQPSLVDGGAPTGEFGSLTRATLSDAVDGSVTSVDAGRPWSASVTGIGDVAGVMTAAVGMAVQKRGRTTEHTFGTVVSTDFTVSINYGSDVGARVLHHQIRIDTDTTRSTRFSDHGDSGSVVMDGSRNIVGLLFAGSNDGVMTFANPIRAVLDELSVDVLLPQAPPPATRPIISCLNTRISVCLRTREPWGICNVVTRVPPLCVWPTRMTWCNTVTRPSLCRVTRPPVCQVQVTRAQCTFPTRACGEFPGGGGGGGGLDDASVYPGGDSGAQTGGLYGSSDHLSEITDEAFWAGYLAAIEEVDQADEADQADQVGGAGGASQSSGSGRI